MQHPEAKTISYSPAIRSSWFSGSTESRKAIRAVNERMKLVEANADLSVRQLWSAEAEDFRFGPSIRLRPSIRGIKADRVGIFGESKDEGSKAEVSGFRTPKASLRWAQRPAIRSLTAIKTAALKLKHGAETSRSRLSCGAAMIRSRSEPSARGFWRSETCARPPWGRRSRLCGADPRRRLG